MSENNRSYNEDEIPLHAFILFSVPLTALIIMKHILSNVRRLDSLTDI